MLSSLHIENVAVIKQADIEFGSGFCVLTGETGAGKSMLIDSVNAILGKRSSKELIRSGSQKAFVRAVFTDISEKAKEKLFEYGFNCENGELIISRTITQASSSVRINSCVASTSAVKSIAPFLIDIHGQHDSQVLLDSDTHYIYIDLIAKNQALLDEYGKTFSKMQALRKELTALTEQYKSSVGKADMLKFQISELEQAEIKPGEREMLLKRKKVMENAERLNNALSGVKYALFGDSDSSSGAIEMIQTASGDVSAVVSENDESFSPLIKSLAASLDALEEASDAVNAIENNIDFDAQEQQLVEQRLEMYYRLSKKYGADENAMLDFLAKAKSELHSIEISDKLINEKNLELKQCVELLKQQGTALTQSRKKAAEGICKSVSEQLEFLDMPKVKFSVSIENSPYSRHGANKIEFLISTNPGEPLKSLSKIASGGEMSRIMLAIKNVLADDDTVDTMIFDEIDTGISGSAARKVGIKLKQTSQNRQIICVTHLAQIASLADCHYLIKKNISGERAQTDITLLDTDNRKRELARIIGSDITQATLSAAEEMMNFKLP